MNIIQLLTNQRAYEGITHSQWGASWNWRWRRVGDDEERRSPSPEPQTDSRSALSRKNRSRRRLRLMDHDNSFSLIFFWARQERGARPGGLCPLRGPSLVDLGSKNSYILYKNSSQSFAPFRELLFLHKKTPC